MQLRDKWEKSWNYAKKLQMFMVVIIIALTLTAIVVSTSSSISYLTRQNEQYVSEQLSAMGSEYDSILQQCKAVVSSLVMDKNVQKYCGFTEASTDMSEVGGDVYNVLMNTLYMQNNANFIVIENNSTGTYTYNGNYSISESKFEQVRERDFAGSIQAKSRGSLRMNIADNYYRQHCYTLSLYFPVYSLTRLDTEIGMVIMNFDNSFLEHLNNRTHYTFSSLYLTDISGNILSNTNRGEIGKQVEYTDKLTGDSGSFWHKNQFVNYQRIGDWNYFLINEISAAHLYQGSYQIIILLLAAMLIFLLGSLLAANRMAKALYQPMDKVISKMNDVSSGNLRTRISMEQMDSDSRKLAAGFNTMMDEIDVLMKQVAEEERRIAQLRFDGLQSQIQPHFLYNTLECIHWQALADEDTDTSKLIKALARYYRICLSEGQDVIPLAMELEHVGNYLIIQNLRYDNIIELEVRISEEEQRILIPKITLQPLIENCIYHGIRVKEGRRGRIEIYTIKEEEQLYLVVDDDGQGMSQEKVDYINAHIADFDQTIGYGINNVNKRIELLYGKEYGVRYSLNELGGVRVKISLFTGDTSTPKLKQRCTNRRDYV